MRYLHVMSAISRTESPDAITTEDPDDPEETAAWLALSRAATTGTRAWLAAAIRAGSPIELMNASRERLVALGLAARSGRGRPPALPPLAQMRAVIDHAARLGIDVAPISSRRYPPMLRSLDDPPLFLFYKGAVPATIEPCVAVVGARRASNYGRRVAEVAAERLAAAGFWVVSGMALGIDAAAHRGALRRGRTIAVLAGGLDRPSPPSHAGLYRDILETGGAISEHPPRTASYPSHFPIRNRIITGLCPLVVVVEAGLRSGSLVSARLAAAQGRELAAVPGNIDNAGSAGTNRLIRDGAMPLIDMDELVETALEAARRFGQAAAAASEVAADCPNDGKSDGPTVSGTDGDRILRVLSNEPIHVDAVAAAVGLDESLVMTLLTALELDGLVARLAEGTFVRAGDLTPH